MSDRRRRRLLAILMLDIAGFSRMMGRDDEGTTDRVVRFHDEVETLVTANGGRVVDTAGDSVFGAFESIVAALECATAIQQGLAKDDDPDRIMVRIGLHLGDVLVEDDRYFGDGVNVAARLQELAPVGGIAASEMAHHEVAGRLPWRDAGVRRLKNIARPVRVFVAAPANFGFGAVTEPAELEGLPVPAELAELIRDRIAEKRRRHPGVELPEGDDAPPRREHPRTVSGVLAAAGFWMQAAVGTLLVVAWFNGWTANGAYPFVGSILLGGAVGALLRGALRRPGVGRLVSALGLAAGSFFLGGAVPRAIAWVVAAAIAGPALVTVARGSGQPED